ncbi:manganese efflux pump [Pseudoflavonifractor sp. 60]|uniref:manganese efflux pump MntP n=1 Tax=Pseudoflavonifractor sp. 60 TaxID=2304576 RepID=UPI00136F679F|nr:manganese efflux pump MntP family protein [Pseudoflavonifractor sp. 60]NBI68075.1 manganese efflux pump [Pseudoflavonifractor sp. 60]
MELYELLILAVSLSMDAFSVSVCKGLSTGRPRPGQCLVCGIWFGGFQALMPLIGWLLGVRFQGMIVAVDHWIAFFLLGFIGFNMVREARSGEAEALDGSFSPRAMLPLALATSIDALAVGVTFAFLQADIFPAVALIGIITFLLSAAGVQVGAVFGGRLKSRAELAGGLVLMGMGVKILLEHTLLG